MNGSVLSLGPQVLSDADMKIGVGLPPDEQEGQVGAPEIREIDEPADTARIVLASRWS